MAIELITATTPLTTPLVQHFADMVIAEINTADSLLDTDVSCWHDLHAYIDTGDLTCHVPWGVEVVTPTAPDGFRWLIAIEHRVDEIIHETTGTDPCGKMTQPDAFGTEQITGIEEDWWQCVPGCDNQPDSSGFYAADSDGNIVGPAATNSIEPDPTNWDGVTYACADCGRLIDSNTGAVIGQRTAAAT